MGVYFLQLDGQPADQHPSVAIRTILPSIISSLQGFASGGPVKLMLNEISYKPFISFFNVTQAAASNPLLGGIGASLTRTAFVYRRS